MEARETWDCVEKSFQETVTYDSTPNDNSWISFGFISPPPPPPSNIVAKKRFISTHFAQNSTLFELEGRGR